MLNSVPYVSSSTSTCDYTSSLNEDGFVIIEGLFSQKDLQKLQVEIDESFSKSKFCKGFFYGEKTKRFGRVFAKSKMSHQLALHPVIMNIVKEVLGHNCEEIQMNLTQAIEIHPSSPAQIPHRDQDIWQGCEHTGEKMVNVMFALDDFNCNNGGTRIWPGSHRVADTFIDEKLSVQSEMPAGSVCIFLGSTLHSGGANLSQYRRRGLIMSYCLGWLKPAENPWLSYPPEIAKTFAPELQNLIGYRQDAPSLNNYEGACPSLLLADMQKDKHFSTKLTPEQTIALRIYNEYQTSVKDSVPA